MTTAPTLFERALDYLQPVRDDWRLRVKQRNSKGVPVEVIPVPEDLDGVVPLIEEQTDLGGKVQVTIQHGERDRAAEDQLLRDLDARVAVSRQFVVPRDPLPGTGTTSATGAESSTTVRASSGSARTTLNADPEVFEAQKRNTLLEMEYKRAKLEHNLEHLAPAGRGGDRSITDVILLKMLEQNTNRPATDWPALITAVGSVAVPLLTMLREGHGQQLAELAGMLAEKNGAGGDDFFKVAPKFKALIDMARELGGDSVPTDPMQQALGALGHIATIATSRRPAADQGVSTQGPAPSTGEFQARPVAPAASTSPDDVGRQRVAEFIYAALQECQIGSDPVTVAERMIDDIGLLPADFRRELEVGESSLLACLPTYIGPEAAQALEQDVGQRPHMLEWFAAFVAALRGDSELAGHSGSGGGVAAAESTPGVNGSHTGGSAPFRSGLMPPSATDAARELELPDPE